jgi:chloramphenicol O-acetyltransferase type A
MKKILNKDDWSRKDHFDFFRKFEEPFFGVCIHIDCSKAYQWCKETANSFFLYYLYQSLAAANEVLPFRYRINGEDVLIYDTVNASPTINRPDGSFGFAYMDYKPSFDEFKIGAQRETESVQQSKGLIPAVAGGNVIHYSSIPWLNFTSLSHARSFSFPDSCPKISFGQMTMQGTIRSMPVSIHVHHALMDGYHVGQFVDRFQELMNG